MIARREREIREFKPESYYGMTARCAGMPLTLTWQDGKTKSSRSFDKKRIEALAAALRGQNGTVSEIKKTPKKTYAPQLYDLTELQREPTAGSAIRPRKP